MLETHTLTEKVYAIKNIFVSVFKAGKTIALLIF